MAALVTALVLLVFVAGYRFYARFIGERIFQDRDPDFVTPAHALEDGHDFVPTKRGVLFGHHFTSIAGAAPIIGPCVAAYWGWLPALLWVVLGTVFMGAVHDYGALVVSAREQGRSIADVAAKVISPRVRLMFLFFILVLSWLVLAVFAMAIAGLFTSIPSSVLPVNASILVALVMGWLLYKRGIPALIPSLIALAALYAFVYLGTKVPLSLADVGMAPEQANLTWILALFAYSAVASLLPVWLLLQPRDYVNSHQLFVGLGLLFIGLFVAHPDFDAPAVRWSEEGAPSMIPFLFVTIACGAISGFHGLVASGTTSKQLDKIEDARPIGYGSMLGEGALALASTMAAVAGISLVGFCELGGQEIPDLSWAVYYDTWAHASGNKAAAFVLGGAAFLQELGLSAVLAQTLMAVLVISFASTTLDTATRIERLIVAEIGEALKIEALTNPYVATLVAIIPAILLATLRVSDASGQVREAGWALWPMFGAGNQMIASLTLLVVALYFWQRKRPVLPLVIPMVFVMIVTLISLVLHLLDFWAHQSWLLFGLSVVLTSLILWMGGESVALLLRRLREGSAEP
ncbi:carbon starvation protein A [Pseudenhygromyxa sp. WMMC2535]|uniref:carbon starvation CstA family protein n=1 Tax=Pseudenhygromyxa sp. WMMC2535 TaxID=2712867 RepID=UPI001556B350|nr:carbon starvation protein A [Pseudenhygromyxa sp. WMMC2535]NVB37159.1 carbon starvation protein A [Pseudenhygromyxa sp. WMMC2535]